MSWPPFCELRPHPAGSGLTCALPGQHVEVEEAPADSDVTTAGSTNQLTADSSQTAAQKTPAQDKAIGFFKAFLIPVSAADAGTARG